MQVAEVQTQHVPQGNTRLWEIDVLRGLAVVLMIFFHGVWDLAYFRLAAVDVFSLPWQVFARSIGATFTLLLGLSLALQAERSPTPLPFLPTLRRGLVIFGLGMAITLVTYVALGPGFVLFGILHMLGLSLILVYPFVRLPVWFSLTAAVIVIGAGVALSGIVVVHPWLIWFGVPQQGRAMVDYYPLLPWYGFALLGVAVGRTLYPRGRRRIALPDHSRVLPVRALRFLGRHSLPIYLLHQPILLGILLTLGARPRAFAGGPLL
jgi:uncharacterized membrane protein